MAAAQAVEIPSGPILPGAVGSVGLRVSGAGDTGFADGFESLLAADAGSEVPVKDTADVLAATHSPQIPAKARVAGDRFARPMQSLPSPLPRAQTSLANANRTAPTTAFAQPAPVQADRRSEKSGTVSALTARGKALLEDPPKAPRASETAAHASASVPAPPDTPLATAQVPRLGQQHVAFASTESDSSSFTAGQSDSLTLPHSGTVPFPELQAEQHTESLPATHQQAPAESSQKSSSQNSSMLPLVDSGRASSAHLLTEQRDVAPAQDTASCLGQDPAHRIEVAPPARSSIKPISRANTSLPGADPLPAHTLSQPGGQDPLRESNSFAAPKLAPPSQISAQPSDQDTFAALDSSTSPTTTWIHAGAHHAEAGYLDSSLGWVSVRADAGAAGLHAAIVPGSALAASTLGDHLAGLNAFLAEHNHAATVTLAPTATTSTPLGSPLDNATSGQGNHQPQDRNAGHDLRPSTLSGENATKATLSMSSQPAAALPTGNGVYLSVLA